VAGSVVAMARAACAVATARHQNSAAAAGLPISAKSAAVVVDAAAITGVTCATCGGHSSVFGWCLPVANAVAVCSVFAGANAIRAVTARGIAVRNIGE